MPRDDSNDSLISYGYDGAGRSRWLSEPIAAGELRCETRSYDGHRLQQVDYWTHSSDCSGTPANPETVSFDYDNLDRRTSVTDTRGGDPDDTVYTYDQAGRVIKRQDNHINDGVGWRWSVAGKKIMLVYVGSWVPVYFSHDNLGRLDVTRVGWVGGPIPLVDHEFDKDGLLTKELLNNSTAKYREYDYYDSGQLENYRQDFDQLDLIDTHLTWNPDGRLDSECTDDTLNGTCSSTPNNHIYDLAGQLRGVGEGCEFTAGAPDGDCDYAYTYDGHGNHTNKTTPDGDYTFTNNRADQVTLEQEAGGDSSTYSYDWAGRVTAVETNDSSQQDVHDETFDYGLDGHLSRYTQSPSTSASILDFTHDADGNLMHMDIDNNGDETVDGYFDAVWDDINGVPQMVATILDLDGAGTAWPTVKLRANYGMRRLDWNGGWFGYDWQGSVVESDDYSSAPQ